MAIHPEFKVDGPVMDEACSYACDHGHVFVIDIGKCKSDSWQVLGLRNLVKRYPEMKFVACHLLAPSDKDKDKLRQALEVLAVSGICGLICQVWSITAGQIPIPILKPLSLSVWPKKS